MIRTSEVLSNLRMQENVNIHTTSEIRTHDSSVLAFQAYKRLLPSRPQGSSNPLPWCVNKQMYEDKGMLMCVCVSVCVKTKRDVACS